MKEDNNILTSHYNNEQKKKDLINKVFAFLHKCKRSEKPCHVKEPKELDEKSNNGLLQ